MSNIMNIGTSALMAYQAALTVASQNIANADTPFYSRRTVDFSENPYNSGVNIKDINRVYDETANRYVQTTNSDAAKWNVYLQQMGNFEPLFDTNSTSIGTYITNSLGALQQIENNFNPSNRALFLSQLDTLSNQFQFVNNEINTQIKNVNLSLQTEVEQVNNILSALNGINQEMLAALNVDHPELLDQRESLVQELSTYMNFNTSYDQNGLLVLSLTNGQTILSMNPPVTFTTINDPVNPQNVKIAVDNGVAVMDVTDLITGGEIAGWLEYRTQGLEKAQKDLGRLALVFADNLNKQNALGVDGNGNLGGNIFADINSSGAINSRVISNSNNVGTSSITVSIDDTAALNTSDYRLNIGVGSTYTLTRLSDNAVVSTGSLSTLPASISVDGFTIDVASGTFMQGDRYTISPTRGAANNMTLAMSDPSQLALGWPVTARNGVKQSGSNGSIAVTSITDTTNSAFATPKTLDPPIEVRFSVTAGVTQYTLWDLNANAAIEGPINYTPGADIFPTGGGYDPGYRVKIYGNNIQDGDTFFIEYNSNSTSDNRNARAMADLYNQPTVLGANGQMVTFYEGYSLLSRDISVKTNNAMSRATSSANLKAQAEQRRDSISGVSLEEETLDLSHYQLAYQASAQVLQIAKSIFDIIASIRG